jgi:serine/threonine-protein kinase RsbW
VILELCLPALNIVTPYILSRVDTAVARAGLQDLCDDVQIVLAEALNNIAEHAYGRVALGAVAVTVARHGNDLCIDIADWGRPFVQDVIHDAPGPAPEDLAEGGYGRFLIQALSSEARHTRGGGRNNLFLRFAA